MNAYQYATNPVLMIDPLGLYSQEKCDSIRRRINNLEDELFNKRYPDLAKNPSGLPYKAWPGSKLRDTVQGHEILVTITQRNLDNAWKEWYDNGCDNPPPASPITCPNTKNASQDSKSGIKAEDVAKGVVVAGGTIGASYLIYRGVRLLPSLFPLLWPTLPANLVIP